MHRPGEYQLPCINRGLKVELIYEWTVRRCHHRDSASKPGQYTLCPSGASSSQYTQSPLHLLPVYSKLAPSPPSTLKARSISSQYTQSSLQRLPVHSQSSLQFIPVHSELTQSRLIYLVFKLESRATENIKLERLDICLNSCSVLNFLIFLGFKSHKLVVPYSR